jgi:hypothetical protein
MPSKQAGVEIPLGPNHRTPIAKRRRSVAEPRLPASSYRDRFRGFVPLLLSSFLGNVSARGGAVTLRLTPGSEPSAATTGPNFISPVRHSIPHPPKEKAPRTGL